MTVYVFAISKSGRKNLTAFHSIDDALAFYGVENLEDFFYVLGEVFDHIELLTREDFLIAKRGQQAHQHTKAYMMFI